jgi:hypothetical protein
LPNSNKNTPIRVSPKPKRRKHLNNIFLDDCGFPDVSNDYDHVLHDVDGGLILRKLWPPKPDLSVPIDPLYYLPFIAKKHEEIMKRDMDLLHLKPDLQERIYDVIRHHWMRKASLSPSSTMNVLLIPGTVGRLQLRRSYMASKRPSSCANALQR